ncbi:S-methyl-5'-thioadenosine phosphorylase [Streptomyces alboniger]
MFSAVGIVFKGSGFYRNDSRGSSSSSTPSTAPKTSSDAKTPVRRPRPARRPPRTRSRRGLLDVRLLVGVQLGRVGVFRGLRLSGSGFGHLASACGFGRLAAASARLAASGLRLRLRLHQKFFGTPPFNDGGVIGASMPHRAGHGEHGERDAGRSRCIGGSGFYSFLDQVTEAPGRHPLWRPQRLPLPRRARRAAGRLPAPARPRPPSASAPHQLPRQPLGPALGGRAAGARAVRGRWPAGRVRSGTLLLVPDQLVDRTKARVQTGSPRSAAAGRHRARRGARVARRPVLPGGAGRRAEGRSRPRLEAVDGGTLVVVEGPRFSTRAESRWHAAQGWSVVGMTGHPEAALARELKLC